MTAFAIKALGGAGAPVAARRLARTQAEAVEHAGVESIDDVLHEGEFVIEWASSSVLPWVLGPDGSSVDLESDTVRDAREAAAAADRSARAALEDIDRRAIRALRELAVNPGDGGAMARLDALEADAAQQRRALVS